MKMNIQDLRWYVFIACWGLWAAIANHWTVKTIFYNFDYYKFAFTASYDDLQAYRFIYPGYRESQNYYAVLQQCNAIVPASKRIQMVLPAEQRKRLEFLEQMARYILYPRNDGDNQSPGDYILVYDVTNYERPEGFKVIKTLTSRACLLGRTGADE